MDLYRLTRGVSLAAREGKNTAGKLALPWKRRLSVTARRAMVRQAHDALRTYLRDDPQDSTGDDLEMNDLLSLTQSLGLQHWLANA